MSTDKIGRYRIQAVLARNLTSTVYAAWDDHLGRKVAVKALPVPDRRDPETKEALLRFSRGARAAGILSHPNIVTVYDYGEMEEIAYLVMEFVDGVTLQQVLEKKEKLTVAEILPLLNDVLDGLRYSHQHGIVHRDIKPANIMVLADGRAKITDFGIARFENSDITQVGITIGTPAYMSPEQFMEEVVDFRTDIYSTGVVLYQLLTGRRPYEGSQGTIRNKVLNTAPVLPSQVTGASPRAFDAVVGRAMAKRREDRFGSADEFARAVGVAATAPGAGRTGVGGMLPERVRLASRTERKQARARRWGLATVVPIAAGSMAALAVGGALLWYGRSRSPPITPAAMKPALTASQTASAGTAVPPVAPNLPITSDPPSPPGDQSVGASPAPPPSLESRVTEGPLIETPNPPSATPRASEAPFVEAAGTKALAEAPPGTRPTEVPPDRSPKATVQDLPGRAAPHPAPAAAPTHSAPVERKNHLAALSPPPPPAPPVEHAKIFIYYLRGSDAALYFTTRIAQRLKSSDFVFGATRSAKDVPDLPEIRYFHPEDAGAARQLADLLGVLGMEFHVRDWSARSEMEPRSALQVWVRQ